MIRTFARLALASAALGVVPAPAQDPAKAPANAARPPADADRPAPVVLDAATLAKLREVAFEAAREGDLPTLKAYFEARQPAEIANGRGDTLLILAAYHGHEEAVRLLLDQAKTKVDARNKMGFTALTGASFKGYLPIARQLVDKGADIDASNASGQTPLMFAAMFGRAEVVRYLVDRGVDPGRRDSQGRTALDLARAQGEGNAEVVKLLEAAPAKKPEPVAAPAPAPAPKR